MSHCAQASCHPARQDHRVSPTTGATSAAGSTGSNSSGKARVSFSEEVEDSEFHVEESSADEDEGTFADAAELEPAPTAAAEPVCVPGKKRGRPADTPLQKAEKAMKKAEQLKKDAKRDLFKRRDEFKTGAMWDAPSVAQRVKESILKQADKVLELKMAYVTAREAYVQARVEDAVQKALKLERKEASVVYAMYDQMLAEVRLGGLLKVQRALVAPESFM